MAIRDVAVRLYAAIIVIFFVVILSFAWPSAVSSACDCPVISRDTILRYARSGVGSPYVWGGDRWNPDNRKWGGADCSGFVAKSWQVPRYAKYTESTGHPYTTLSFYSGTNHWYVISRSDLAKGDALVYRKDGSGHVVIFEKGDPWGQATVYEARGKNYGIIHAARTFGSAYKARRRHRLSDVKPTIIASRKISNGNYSTAQPYNWATTKLYFNNIDAYGYNFFVTNTSKSLSNSTSFRIRNHLTSIVKKASIKSLSGKDYTSIIRSSNNTSKLRHALGYITSDRPTMVSARSNRGYIYQAAPVSYAASPVVCLGVFDTSEDSLYVTNPTSGSLKIKIELFKANRLVYRGYKTLRARELRQYHWKRNTTVRNRARKVFVKVTAGRSILASRRLPSVSYQPAKPEKMKSRNAYIEHYYPAKDVIYIANTASDKRSSVNVKIYRNGSLVYQTNRLIEKRHVISVNLSKTSLRSYTGLTVVLKSSGGSILASRRLPGGHFVDAFPTQNVKSKIYLQRFDPSSQKIAVANPGESSIISRAFFYSNQKLIHSYTKTIKGRATSVLDFSNSVIKNHKNVFVILRADYN